MNFLYRKRARSEEAQKEERARIADQAIKEFTEGRRAREEEKVEAAEKKKAEEVEAAESLRVQLAAMTQRAEVAEKAAAKKEKTYLMLSNWIVDKNKKLSEKRKYEILQEEKKTKLRNAQEDEVRNKRTYLNEKQNALKQCDGYDDAEQARVSLKTAEDKLKNMPLPLQGKEKERKEEVRVRRSKGKLLQDFTNQLKWNVDRSEREEIFRRLTNKYYDMFDGNGINAELNYPSLWDKSDGSGEGTPTYGVGAPGGGKRTKRRKTKKRKSKRKRKTRSKRRKRRKTRRNK